MNMTGMTIFRWKETEERLMCISVRAYGTYMPEVWSSSNTPTCACGPCTFCVYVPSVLLCEHTDA